MPYCRSFTTLLTPFNNSDIHASFLLHDLTGLNLFLVPGAFLYFDRRDYQLIATVKPRETAQTPTLMRHSLDPSSATLSALCQLQQNNTLTSTIGNSLAI